MSGDGGITALTGLLTLSGDNTYTGVTDVRGFADLRVDSANALGATGPGNDTRLANVDVTFGNSAGGPFVVPEAITFGTGVSVVTVTNIGPVTLGGVLNFASTTNFSSQNGSAPLTLAGVLTGPANIGGYLIVIPASAASPDFAGSISGFVQVDGQVPKAQVFGGLLTGTGTVGSAHADTGGTISPGGTAVGTLTANNGLGVQEGRGADFQFCPAT